MVSLISITAPFIRCRSSLPRPLPYYRSRSNCRPVKSKEWKIKCAPQEDETAPSSSSSSSSSLPWSFGSSYSWCSLLGGVGFLETAYLTYLKLTNSDAYCPVGGGACGDVLNSEYAAVFGVPLPLIGMVAYGLVVTLGFGLQRKEELPLGISETTGCLVLNGSATSMAAASSYFLYILSTKFPATLCSYCLISAFLSFSLFFISLKEVGFRDVPKLLGLQLCTVGLVIATLSVSYGFPQPTSSRSLAKVDLPYFVTEITAPSSDFTLSLAKHLHSIGAKMYGAFWCSHCLEQKEMFGKDASKLLDYIECFPNGFKTGTKMAKVCADAKIEGFPTWIINDEVLSGEKELSELAELSGFQSNETSQPN